MRKKCELIEACSKENDLGKVRSGDQRASSLLMAVRNISVNKDRLRSDIACIIWRALNGEGW